MEHNTLNSNRLVGKDPALVAAITKKLNDNNIKIIEDSLDVFVDDNDQVTFWSVFQYEEWAFVAEHRLNYGRPSYAIHLRCVKEPSCGCCLGNYLCERGECPNKNEAAAAPYFEKKYKMNELREVMYEVSDKISADVEIQSLITELRKKYAE